MKAACRLVLAGWEITVRTRRPRPVEVERTPRGSWLVCALLAAALWHAPIPWIHTHDALPGNALSASLAWHLRHFHADGEEPHGWHMHLTLPWDMFRRPNGKTDPASPAPGWVFEMPFVNSDAPPAFADEHQTPAGTALLLPEEQSAATVCLHANPVCGLHFLQTYSSSVSLRALICVALC